MARPKGSYRERMDTQPDQQLKEAPAILNNGIKQSIDQGVSSRICAT